MTRWQTGLLSKRYVCHPYTMKTRLPLIIGLAAIVACIALSSCADLAGTSLTFDSKGGLIIHPPVAPIVIPAK